MRRNRRADYSFESLIAPVSCSTFFERYWERESLHVSRHDDSRFRHILTLSDLDDYLTRSDLRYPAVRLVQTGRTFPVSSYTTSFSLGTYRSSELIRSELVLSHYHSGATILVQLAHLSLPPLRPLVAALERFLGFAVEMNVYLTPPRSQGFTAHFDNHSVLVVQLSGEKTWKLYGERAVQPLLRDRFQRGRDDPGSERLSVLLTPGSVLYVPRGQYHSASTNEEPSLHLTIGLFPPTWLDIFQMHLAMLADDWTEFRRAPTDYQGADALVSRCVSTFDTSRVRRALALSRYTAESQPAEGRLLDLVASPAITARTRLRVRSEANIKSEWIDEAVTIRAFGAIIKLPSSAGEAVRWILARKRSFAPSDLQFTLDTRGALVLCRRLLREGVVSLVSHR